ncbi:Uncharacterized protein HZ326_30909, partial [Fusarium oxysporum f. sp. albedinis]
MRGVEIRKRAMAEWDDPVSLQWDAISLNTGRVSSFAASLFEPATTGLGAGLRSGAKVLQQHIAGSLTLTLTSILLA